MINKEEAETMNVATGTTVGKAVGEHNYEVKVDGDKYEVHRKDNYVANTLEDGMDE